MAPHLWKILDPLLKMLAIISRCPPSPGGWRSHLASPLVVEDEAIRDSVCMPDGHIFVYGDIYCLCCGPGFNVRVSVSFSLTQKAGA